MDLRKEFDSIIRDHGHDILLVRTDRRIHCKCFDYQNNAPDSDCPLCFGTGWITRVEKHKVVSQVASVPETLPRLSRLEEIGKLQYPAEIYYFKHNTKPKAQDLIIETDWDDYGRPISRTMDIYKINHSRPMREKRGRVEYYSVAASAQRSNSNIISAELREYKGIINYDLKWDRGSGML